MAKAKKQLTDMLLALTKKVDDMAKGHEFWLEEGGSDALTRKYLALKAISEEAKRLLKKKLTQQNEG